MQCTLQSKKPSLKHKAKKIFLLLSLLMFLFLSYSPVLSQENYPIIAEMENVLFGMTSPGLKISDRISALEKDAFGKTYTSDALDIRTERLKINILGNTQDFYEQNYNSTDTSESRTKDFQDTAGLENLQTTEVNNEQFLAHLYGFINDERSFKGLLPLLKDQVASTVAQEQSNEILKKNYLSYSNSKNQFPDERYTLAGGTGATIEVIKGFEKDPKEKRIKLNELLAKQLLQAIEANPDDRNILYSPYINHIGIGFSVSSDKKKFVSVVEFLTKGGAFEPVKPAISLNEKFKITGRVNSPYKFKAVAIAYNDSVRYNFDNDDSPQNFGNENLKPYFPPQDYIAYSNTAKSTFVKVLKGIGVIGAIGAAPFTGGASVILAPALISSIQNGPPKEIPLKGGIKVKGSGEFSGEIDLNYQGKGGLYYVSVLAELPGVNFPIVISRRTIRVNGFLPTAENALNRLILVTSNHSSLKSSEVLKE